MELCIARYAIACMKRLCLCREVVVANGSNVTSFWVSSSKIVTNTVHRKFYSYYDMELNLAATLAMWPCTRSHLIACSALFYIFLS